MLAALPEYAFTLVYVLCKIDIRAHAYENKIVVLAVLLVQC